MIYSLFAGLDSARILDSKISIFSIFYGMLSPKGVNYSQPIEVFISRSFTSTLRKEQGDFSSFTLDPTFETGRGGESLKRTIAVAMFPPVAFVCQLDLGRRLVRFKDINCFHASSLFLCPFPAV